MEGLDLESDYFHVLLHLLVESGRQLVLLHPDIVQGHFAHLLLLQVVDGAAVLEVRDQQFVGEGGEELSHALGHLLLEL